MEIRGNLENDLKRSFCLSLAVRWKHEQFRLIFMTALLALLFVSAFLSLLHAASAKYVTLVVNGKETKVTTRQAHMDSFLEEQGITLGEHDRLSASLDSQIANGERIVIQQPVPIKLTADGETKTVYTTGKTVEGALQDLNVSLGNFDRITPDLHEEITANTAIQIVRVRKIADEAAEPIQYQVVKKYDASLPEGTERTVQEGKQGMLLKRKMTTYIDGALVSEDFVDQSVQSESVNKIVAVGTKKTAQAVSISSDSDGQLSKDGLNFPVKRILNGVTLTAYTAGFASTGKSKGDPQYGVTATGTHVSEGRTIAVDPNIIPLGWWVYIDGIGFRRAEDTGSAIKGQKIDVYYNSESFAKQFGLKHGVTVYVIGPEKPDVE